MDAFDARRSLEVFEQQPANQCATAKASYILDRLGEKLTMLFIGLRGSIEEVQ